MNLGLGLEIQSGNDYNGDAGENKAFTPFYGTNHKFNGFMDYFYVGNHANSVGLVDIYAKLSTKLGEKSSLTAFLHSFSAQGEIGNNVDKKLGTEFDLVYSDWRYDFYENGVFTQTLTLTAACNTTSSNVYIGALNPAVLSSYYDGNISQASIYNRALSAAEITQNFNVSRLNTRI